MKISRSAYTAEFKELAVKRIQAGASIPATANELGINDQTLRNWLKAAASGTLNGAGSSLSLGTEKDPFSYEDYVLE